MLNFRNNGSWLQLINQPVLGLFNAGQVSEVALKRWLVQHAYVFEGMLKLHGSLIPRAKQRHRLILAQSLVVLVEELDWIGDLQATEEAPHPDSQRYWDFWTGLEPEPYALGLAAVWIRQRAFTDVLLKIDRQDGLVGDFLNHWTASEAQALLHDLGTLFLESRDQLAASRLEKCTNELLNLELKLWQMALQLARPQSNWPDTQPKEDDSR